MYERPAANTPTARLQIAAQNFGIAATSDYWIFRDAQCATGPGTGRLALMDRGTNDREVDLEADREVFVRVYVAESKRDLGIGWRRHACLALVRLTPVAGRTYRVSNLGISLEERCRVELVDAKTGRPPPEAKPAPITESCRTNDFR